MPEKDMTQSDHDLLIRIDTKLGLLISQFHDHKDEAVKRIGVLEENKMDKSEALRLKDTADNVHDDHENRLRRLERYGAIAIGGVALAQVVISVYLTL